LKTDSNLTLLIAFLPTSLKNYAISGLGNTQTVMQHIEFFDREHFQLRYHRITPPVSLSHFIDFFWQTDFDELLKIHPAGFSDVLFPNTGYTYLINLGTPYIMQVGENKFDMKGDGFLPRHQSIECFHRPGNRLFGIKFRVSPVLFEKKINFSEYRGHIYPLSYLVDPRVVAGIKSAENFEERVILLCEYYHRIVNNSPGLVSPVSIVLNVLNHTQINNDFSTPVSYYASKHNISVRTLQRYFEIATGVSPRKLLQIMRIRKATETLVTDPANFSYSQFGYYDHSHFYKYLKQFLAKKTIITIIPHLELLRSMHNRSGGC
jgi:AraC-like DNA-binding protein